MLPLHRLQEFDRSRPSTVLVIILCLSRIERSPDLVHRRISQGQARVEAPAACLINCHFTEEERGSSVVTTAAYVCVRLVTMSTAAHVEIDNDREARASAQRSRPECDFFFFSSSVPQTVHIMQLTLSPFQ